jgi:hypothetical protein
MLGEWFEKRFFECIFWGVALNIGGGLLSACRHYPFLEIPGYVMVVTGIGLIMAGLAFYARSKGRHPAWCILGLLSVLGLLVIVLLPPGKER